MKVERKNSGLMRNEGFWFNSKLSNPENFERRMLMKQS